jgi:hypothetical protein
MANPFTSAFWHSKSRPVLVAEIQIQRSNIMSFLSTIGKDFKSVFAWLGSAKGQAVVSTAGAVVEAIDPGLTGIVTLAEQWITKAIATESLAAAAGQQTGSGAQKAAAVLSAMEPVVAEYFPAATQAELAAANTAIVAFLNAFGSPSQTAPATSA